MLWLVRDWLSLLSLIREAHPPTLFRSSDPWVAARPSGSLEGGPGGRVVTVVASFPVGSECELQESVAAVVGCACCERGCYFRSCCGWLFEFIAYLTELNSNPSGSSDPWVATQPSGSLAGVREVGSLQLMTRNI
ncbi:hypothetical protein Taro_046667 [Colocasia esculenta]|uniref:Secreted protein n=1 Tax=Colocasia esculenta TaxID=4460 RepID=A0A843X4F5_COLES|nr:hypothetical protein [Colocasia esculenta]